MIVMISKINIFEEALTKGGDKGTCSSKFRMSSIIFCSRKHPFVEISYRVCLAADGAGKKVLLFPSIII